MTINALCQSNIQDLIALMQQRGKQTNSCIPCIGQPDVELYKKYRDFLLKQLNDTSTLGFIAINNDHVDGFILGRTILPPPVYNPGLTYMTEEFIVHSPDLWPSIGKNLLETIRQEAARKSAVQIVVAAPAHEHYQNTLLHESGLSPSSSWWTGKVENNLVDNKVRIVEKKDIEEIVSLSAIKRTAYEKVQPLFWKMSPNSDQAQSIFFEKQIANMQVDDKRKPIILLHETNDSIDGFIIAHLVPVHPLYDSQLVCKVDDFMVRDPYAWLTIGKALLQATAYYARAREVSQFLIVAGVHDIPKLALMKNLQFSLDSYWWTGRILQHSYY